MASQLNGRGSVPIEAPYYKNVGYNVVAVSMSSEDGAYPAANGIDGDDSTAALSSASSVPHWYQVDLGMPKPISRWQFLTSSFAEYVANNFVKSCGLQYYNGNIWVTVDTVQENVERYIDRVFPEVTAQIWRVLVTEAGTDGLLRVYAFNLFEKMGARITAPACSPLPVTGNWLQYNQPDPYAGLGDNPSAWGGDSQPITSYDDSRAFMSGWSPPKAGYADEHLTISLTAGMVNRYMKILDFNGSLLANLGSYGGDPGETKTLVVAPGTYNEGTGHVMLYPNQCYKIQFDSGGNARWQPYESTLSWS